MTDAIVAGMYPYVYKEKNAHEKLWLVLLVERDEKGYAINNDSVIYKRDLTYYEAESVANEYKQQLRNQ